MYSAHVTQAQNACFREKKGPQQSYLMCIVCMQGEKKARVNISRAFCYCIEVGNAVALYLRAFTSNQLVRELAGVWCTSPEWR